MHTTLIYRILAHIHTVHTQMHITYCTHIHEDTHKHTVHTTLNILGWTNTHMHTHA